MSTSVASVPPGSDAGEVAWQRLSARMIWVDAVQSVLSLAPGAIAVWVVGVEPTLASLWPLGVVAVLGVVGAVTDALRWVFTRYRVTDDEVQRRTGVLVRRHRSVRRDRIRSVDTQAKLRHRVAGLRVVTIGAGQQTSAGEAAFVLDAVTRVDAERLRQVLLRERGGDATGRAGSIQAPVVAGAAGAAGAPTVAGAPADVPGEPAPAVDDVAVVAMSAQPGSGDGVEVLARLRPWWVVYNMFNVWAYLMALGLLWGAYWLATTFGVDVAGMVAGLADWRALGWPTTIAVGLLLVGALGVAGLAVSFFTENWGFELARVPSEDGTVLRTRRGLLQTREVTRDERRMRGMSIGEPLLWRWMRMADTNVITTGLSLWASSQPTTILPRGPVGVAREVVAAVLDERPSPLEVPLSRHPANALRRRLWWATAVTAMVVGVLAWLAGAGVLPTRAVWAGLWVWPIALLGALAAYRALGHAIVGPYVVTRSGLLSRTTAALQRDAVSTIAVRESILQRRLGLATVSAMTAAGWAIYEAPDVPADEAVAFAAAAAPGLLDPFLEPSRPGVA